MTSPDKQAVPEDNQGASADADRAATASQPSQQAVSGIAGIPSAVSLSDFEAIDGLHSQLLRMGDFETCADPRGYVRTSNRLFDACIEAGMPFDEDDHEVWATEFVTRCLTSATMVECAA